MHKNIIRWSCGLIDKDDQSINNDNHCYFAGARAQVQRDRRLQEPEEDALVQERADQGTEGEAQRGERGRHGGRGIECFF